MSTATVSSPKNRGNKQNPAKWDDEKTRILLEAFEKEINDENRPTGIFSKIGWSNIIRNFNHKSGLNYNKNQLKNRQDNLHREYTKWEKLIGRETGLGWDHEKQTVDAPDEWWDEKAKTDPAILKYRDAGPVHLELLQKVFQGVTATGAYSYIPDDDTDLLLNTGDRFEHLQPHINDDDFLNNFNSDFFASDEPEPTQVHTPSSSNLRGPKRQRPSSGSRLSSTDKFHHSMEHMTSTMREGFQRFSTLRRGNDVEETMTYKDALMLLKGVPGLTPTHPLYVKGVRILVDKLQRVAFEHMLEDGPDAVIAWIQSFP